MIISFYMKRLLIFYSAKVFISEDHFFSTWFNFLADSLLTIFFSPLLSCQKIAIFCFFWKHEKFFLAVNKSSMRFFVLSILGWKKAILLWIDCCIAVLVQDRKKQELNGSYQILEYTSDHGICSLNEWKKVHLFRPLGKLTTSNPLGCIRNWLIESTQNWFLLTFPSCFFDKPFLQHFKVSTYFSRANMDFHLKKDIEWHYEKRTISWKEIPG